MATSPRRRLGPKLVALIVGLVLVAAFGGYVVFLYSHHPSQPARQVMLSFVQELCAGDVERAVADSHPNVARADVEDMAKWIKGWGGVREIQVEEETYYPQKENVWYFVGLISFDCGRCPYEARVMQHNGVWKIHALMPEADPPRLISASPLATSH